MNMFSSLRVELEGTPEIGLRLSSRIPYSCLWFHLEICTSGDFVSLGTHVWVSPVRF